MLDDRELESVLDDGLARYSGAEPLAGMEERILQRVCGQRPPKTTAAIAGFACAAAAAVVAFVMLVPVRVEPPTPARMKPKLSEMQWQTTKSDGLPHLQRRARRATILPKQPEFPARTPLTPEERVLLQTASSSTELAKNEEPIAIEPIEVTPIVINDSGAENEP